MKYRGKEWVNLSKKILRKKGVCCVECNSNKKLVVHHIKSLVDGGPLLDEKNLQVLCKSCHGEKEKGWNKREKDYDLNWEEKEINWDNSYMLIKKGRKSFIDISDVTKLFNLKDEDLVFVKIKSIRKYSKKEDLKDE